MAGPYMLSNNYSKLPYLTQEVYCSYIPDEVWLDSLLAPAELTYYSTALLWMRLICVKKKLSRVALTTAEQDIFNVIEEKEFNVPEPLYAYLMQIGCINQMQMELEVPALPVASVGGFGGYHAQTISKETHNLFEEVPCLGISADVIMSQQTGMQSQHPNFRVKKPDGSMWTTNLCGVPTNNSKTKNNITQSIKAKLRGQSITGETFPEYIPNTRFDFLHIKEISDTIGAFKTFHNEKVNFSRLGVEGGYSQVVPTKPLANAVDGKWTERSVYTESDNPSSQATNDAFIFGFQLYKEKGTGLNDTATAENWSCLTADPTAACPWTISESWVDSRNANRNLSLGTGTYQGLWKLQDQALRDKVRGMIVTIR